MTFRTRLVSLFPLFMILNIFCIFHCMLKYKEYEYGILWIILSIYFLPVLCFRIHNLFLPLKEGRFDLAEKKYNIWYASHQFQLIYFAVPQFEALLRISGLYSFWLRLWGAKIGKKVYWTPNTTVNDRPLLNVGNNVIFGEKMEFVSHVNTPRGDKLLLYVKAINIGSNVFIGAGSRMGPGVIVEDNTSLPVLTDGYLNQKFESGDYIFKKKD